MLPGPEGSSRVAGKSVRATPRQQDFLRIGELSRRSGVSVDLLRAWERRYGVLEPIRSPGGFRLYSASDEDRVREMREHIARGVAPAEAAMMVRASRVRGGPAPRPASPLPSVPRDPLVAMRAALESFDASAANAAIDLLVASFSIETLLSHVVLPYLREVGERWGQGELSVAQEHFASGILRTRLLEEGRGWDAGDGPRAVLACPPGEHHDLGLIAFGLALRANGWRITFLGADTPVGAICDAADAVAPEIVVLAAVCPGPLEAARCELSGLAARRRLGIGGAGTTSELARDLGAVHLPGDAVGAAKRLAAAHAAPRGDIPATPAPAAQDARLAGTA
ncbi:MAG: MerR family transcriptional regulator [Actinomycetota bacterium]